MKKVEDLSLYKRIQLRIWGRVYLEERWHEKWKTNVPYYLVNCPEHGLFEDHPHGRWLKCPVCGRKFYSSECWVGSGVYYPWPNREVTPWPKGVR